MLDHNESPDIRRIDSLSYSASNFNHNNSAGYPAFGGQSSSVNPFILNTSMLSNHDDTDVNPESAKRLEQEFETTRSRLHDSKVKMRDRSREVSDFKQLNSDLKNKLRTVSPLKQQPSPSPSKLQIYDLEQENDQLESRLKILLQQWKDHQSREVSNYPFSLHDEQTLQNKCQDQETANFMLKAQYSEFSNLKKLMMIFQDENIRLNALLQNGARPSEDDIQFIKSNIVKIREEIDKILAGRTQISQKFQQMFERIEGLTKENEELRLSVKSDTSSSQIANLTSKKLRELNDEIAILKRDLQWAQLTRPDAGLIYRLEHENSQLKQDLENIKTGNSYLQRSVEQQVQASNFKMKERLSNTVSTNYSVVQTVQKRLGEDDYQKEIYLTSDGKFGASRPSQTTQRSVLGVVSNEELVKLEKRIEEFGRCNEDLEDMIYKLKNKIENGNDNVKDPSVSHFSPSKDHQYNTKESQQFGKIIQDLRTQVDKLCAEKNRGDPKAIELLKYLQYLLRDSNITQEVDRSLEFIIMNNKQMAGNLTELKLVNQQLESKYSSMTQINKSNELQIEKLLLQNRQLQDTIQKLVSEVEILKQREKDSLHRTEDSIRKSSTEVASIKEKYSIAQQELAALRARQTYTH